MILLNEQQRLAVEACDKTPLLILAGAGVGKTQVLTSRITFFIRQLGVPPEAILAVTFTKKAANEMLERTLQMNEIPDDLLNISTFHSVCAKLLRQYAELIGFKRYFRILDQDESRKVLTQVCKEKGHHGREVIDEIGRKIDTWRNEGLEPLDCPREDKASQVYSSYRRECKRLQAIDFADLLMHTVRLLKEHSQVAAELRGRWTHILVDEFQDTNPIQYDFIKLLYQLDHTSLTVVGDDYQAIHEWRGACVKNILEFEEDFKGANLVILEQNYRSQSVILDAAHAVIKHNKRQRQKRLIPTLEKGALIQVQALSNEREEAAWVAQYIQDCVAKGNHKRSDFTILYRTNAQSHWFEKALFYMHIPYHVYGGFQFYERKEIKDLLSYLRLSLHPDSDIDVERVLNVPNRGVGDVTLQKLKAVSKEHTCSLLRAVQIGVEECMFKGKAKTGLQRFHELVHHLTGLRNTATPYELLSQCLEKSGYLAWLMEHHEDYHDRLENIDQLLEVLRSYQCTQTFLDDALLVAHDHDQATGEDHVRLMTMHASKGLEFPVVFMTGMCEDGFPHFMAVKEGKIEEERRLCYVGITRAKHKLLMTYPKLKQLGFRVMPMKKSRFIEEIPSYLVEESI